MITANQRGNLPAGQSPRQPCRPGPAGFTLIEMLAVMAIIAILVAISMLVVGRVQRQMAVSAAKSQIATIAAALENYKSDVGYYPVTTIVRISSKGLSEASNNWFLYRALSGANGKRYMRLVSPLAATNTLIPQASAGAPLAVNIFDPWGTPYNYYCSPKTTWGVTNTPPAGWPVYDPQTVADTNYWYGGYAVGGQVNVGSYDLFSYGPDKTTYVTGAVAYSGGYNYAWYFGPAGERFTNTAAAVDDITNFGR